MNVIRLLLFGLLMLLLAGCVDYDEELWLNKDGSGKVHAVVGVLTNYPNQQEFDRYGNIPGIHMIGKSVYKKNEYTYYALDFKFDSLEAFNNLNDQVSNVNLGNIYLEKEPHNQISLRRSISLGSRETDEDEIENLIMQRAQNNLQWKFKLHVPWKIVKANAAPGNIDYKTKTVSWNYQASYLWNKSQTMSLTMKKGFPYLLTILIVFALLVIVGSIIWWKKHQHKRLEAIKAQFAHKEH